MDLAQKVAEFPVSPGVYLMKDAGGRVIYVGKAIDLKKRVSQYLPRESGFAGSSGRGGGLGGSPKESPRSKDTRYQIKFLLARVADIDFVVTGSEKEALLLENTLIKKHRPRYNLQLKDDKSYPSIRLSLKDRFPRVWITRTIKKDGSLYFGPFSSALAARQTVEFIEKFFRLRTCSDRELANRVRPCLQYQIHRCDAPCVGLIEDENYRRIVDQAKLFLQGRKQDLLQLLEEEMRTQSSREEFEKAAATRDLVASIRDTLEKQAVARHLWIDQDVIGLHREGDRMTFCLLMVREGKVWESLLYHLKGQEEDDEALESFLDQFYGEDRYLPDEILLSSQIPSLEPLSELLSERRGKRLEILFPRRGDRHDLIRLAIKNAQQGFRNRAKKAEEIREILSQLQETLSLQNFPRRIECFDISNTSGQEAVGSLVCFVDGMPSKEGYRRFKIKTVERPNDYAMMQEVLKRRLLRIEAVDEEKNSRWEKPDLVVVDGGKGQLNVVLAIMEELNVTGIDVIALAKEKKSERVPAESGLARSGGRNERSIKRKSDGGISGGERDLPLNSTTQDKVYLSGRKNPVLLGRHSGLLHLLMRIRDEAHRFAIAYHRKLRSRHSLRGLQTPK